MSKIIYSLVFIGVLFFPLRAFTQTSLSGHVGLAITDGDLGRLLNVSSDVHFNEKNGLELGFSHLEIEAQDSKNYIIQKYSIMAEHYINSEDKRFQISGKFGPTLLTYTNSEDYKSTLGFDLGLDTSYVLLGPVSINLGISNTFNSNTKLIVQTYFGLSLNFIKK